MTSYRAWLVDLDGTLYHGLPVRAAIGAELLLRGPLHIPLLRRFRREHERTRARIASTSVSPYARQIANTVAGSGRQPSEVESIVREWTQRRPGKWLRLFRRKSILSEIAAFRNAGGRTALVSDYPAMTKLAALGAVDLFDVVVANGEGDGPLALKPDPSGYLLAARLLGVPPEDCLVIGDRPELDGNAATAAGMQFRDVRNSLPSR